MAETNDKTGFTKPNAERKAAATHTEATRIIDAETAARKKKTERLRLMRQAKEAAEPPPEVAPPKRRRK